MPKKKNFQCSWNVNGLRAVCRKGFMDWLNQKPVWDMVHLQETKLKQNQIPPEILSHPDYHFYHSEALKAGYSGVGTLVHKSTPLVEVIEGTGLEEFDNEGRSLTFVTEDYVVINAYYPNGQRDHGRVDYKLRFSEEILQLAKKWSDKTKLPIILTGDFNTAHCEIDLKNPKTNQKTTGFLPIERAWVDRLIDQGFCDVFRHLNPTLEGQYTWWTYRNNCRAKNVGWRIDYFFLDDKHLDKLVDAQILNHVEGSDHCPISLVLFL